ncbi:carboxyl-terminal processing protease [Breznakia sp. PF5-3]|uniref:S41 family peptidase n=1 Tax=unclassified Breznakia TaxID=2623764 RepID=UPI002405EB67|nr:MULTISPECIES: S41 family peptidase [unclassified Breznakia]MDF9824801.1 carboxyl-terminal processing protease [Breznakia sp. PM6-1]MDF9835743.1 carboxyl-terminal processing protease [Breznakia sp. PF5-3]MDF9837829.1 carboxyl-terminal processing protease [Breznakia sp. PFB2-8]MDF9859800.1 carboxyl-terminal processing protease [Breznakia sp. PH5-24]
MDENKKKIMVEKHRWPDEIAREKKKRRIGILIVLACVLCFTGGFFVGGNVGGSSRTTSSRTQSLSAVESEKFQEIYDILASDWYFGKDVKDLESYIIDHAINGIANENDMDTHTEYMDEKSASALLTSLSGSLTGIGIQYYELNDAILVEKIFIDSPAEKAGMKEGDIIKKVDGVDISKKEINDIKEMIIGEEGTKVSVEVQRGKETLTLDMTRAKVSVTVYGYVKDGIGVLELSSFSDDTAVEVERYLEAFKEKKVKNVVIDLRDNGGGYVTTAISIAGLFLGPNEIVLYQEDKNGELSEYATKSSSKQYKFDNVGIIINENTASASELLTAALKEHLDAKVVGTKSYGKGTVQNSISFDDGSIFKYTIAEWLTPTKEKIHKIGIKPDYEVKLNQAMSYKTSDDEETYKVNQVGDPVKDMQVYLSFLGYDVDRKDGYFSESTLAAVKRFQKDNGLTESGEVNAKLVSSAISAASRKWHDEKDVLDTQMKKALEVVSGK